MLRSSRTVATLLRSLLLSSATATVTAVVATSVVGCKDESQPEYWIDKLSDRAWQANSVKRLEQFFEDTFTRSNKDVNSADVKALADKVVEPLTNLYVNSYGDLDEKTRESIIKLIASFRDKRGEPAFKKAFDEFAKSGKGADDVRWAGRAVADLKLDGTAESMGQAFDKMKAAKVSSSVYIDFRESMLKHPSPSWANLLKMKLEPEIVPPGDGKDPERLERFRNEQFWQTVAAQLLGELKDQSAVDPLLKAMLDPAKADVAQSAALALIKIGKPATGRTLKILSDQDPDLSAYSLARVQKATGAKEPPKDKPYIATAAVVLGAMGRSETLDAMVNALRGAKDDATRAVIAREIAKVPSNPASKQAFKQAYEATPIDAQIPNIGNALQTLTESAAQFYDPEFVPWLMERADKTKGSGEEKTNLQSMILLTSIKLMKPDQVGMVGEGVRKWGSQLEKDAFSLGSDLLKRCGDRAACYLSEIEKNENQQKAKQSAGIKSGYMIGIFGNDQVRMQLVDHLGQIENAAVRFVAAQTIDFLSPKGSAETANALEKIIEKNAKTADKDKIAGDFPLKQVMFRIRARAE
jgi:hypothetical protein